MAKKKADSGSSSQKFTKPTNVTTKTKVTSIKVNPAASRSKLLGRFTRLRTPLISAAIAEFLGTFLLAGLVLISRGEPIYVMFGLVGIALAIAAISGAHVNPAITIAAWVNRKISGLRALAFVIAQILGAMLAFVVVAAYVSAAPEVSQQAAMFGQQAAQMFVAADIPARSAWGIFMVEMLGLIVLGFAYARAYQAGRRTLKYALTVGSGMFVALLLASGLAAFVSGTAVLNPAVAISVSALDWELWPILAYIVAPVIGGIVGFSLHELISFKELVADDKEVIV